MMFLGLIMGVLNLNRSLSNVPFDNDFLPPSAKFRTGASRCVEAPNLAENFYRSQHEEDEILLEWFKNICNGRYLEMGALNGLTFSNSYLFAKAMQWTGLLIEASPRHYAKLVHHRPESTAVHAVVCK